MRRAVTVTLAILAGPVPAICLAGNTIWPAPGHGYQVELFTLVALWLAAVWLARQSFNAAVFLYCANALLPVLSMAEYSRAHFGESSLLAWAAPTLGLIAVAYLTRDTRATIGYGIIALVASCALGLIYDSDGQAGGVMFFNCALTALSVGWLGCDIQQAHVKLDELRGEAGRLDKKIQQEFANDP